MNIVPPGFFKQVQQTSKCSIFVVIRWLEPAIVLCPLGIYGTNIHDRNQMCTFTNLVSSASVLQDFVAKLEVESEGCRA